MLFSKKIDFPFVASTYGEFVTTVIITRCGLTNKLVKTCMVSLYQYIYAIECYRKIIYSLPLNKNKIKQNYLKIIYFTCNYFYIHYIS